MSWTSRSMLGRFALCWFIFRTITLPEVLWVTWKKEEISVKPYTLNGPVHELREQKLSLQQKSVWHSAFCHLILYSMIKKNILKIYFILRYFDWRLWLDEYSPIFIWAAWRNWSNRPSSYENWLMSSETFTVLKPYTKVKSSILNKLIKLQSEEIKKKFTSVFNVK